MLPAAFPEPELFLPGTGEPTLRWGVLGPGGIASAFVGAMLAHTAQRPVAVASRSRERADVFAQRHRIDRSYDSYERLVQDRDVDVVYVATPQSTHLELGLLALGAGKHVLIEKPLAMNAGQARTLADAALQSGSFLMEAMWSRYLPHTSVVRRLLADGVLGELRNVFADLSQAIPADPMHRLHRPELGGGALLDLGIYPVQLDSMVLGAPQRITAIGGLTEAGVDAYSTLVLDHGSGVQSTLITSILARSTSTAYIAGTQARVDLAGAFHNPTTITLADNAYDATPMVWNDPTGLTGYDGLSWEATALARFVGEGRLESPLHTLDETVQILETLDDARRQVGVVAG
jgi:predicted dehydrogenase